MSCFTKATRWRDAGAVTATVEAFSARSGHGQSRYGRSRWQGTSTTRISSDFGATATFFLGWETTRSVIFAGSGIVPPGTFTYRAHSYWNRVWQRNYGVSRYASRRGRVGIITFHPFLKTPSGIVARIRRTDLDWARDRIADWRTDGVRWFLVQSEIPAIGPNRGRGSSGLLLRNGNEVWRRFASMGVDLFLAAEFHRDTTHTREGMTPVQIVHGGLSPSKRPGLSSTSTKNALQLTLMESRGSRVGDETIWAPGCRKRLPSHPVAGTPEVIGTMTIRADGTTRDRTGHLQEGIE